MGRSEPELQDSTLQVTGLAIQARSNNSANRKRSSSVFCQVILLFLSDDLINDLIERILDDS